MPGESRLSLLRGEETSPDYLDERIFVAVAALEHGTAACRDGVDPIDTKESAFPDCDTTFVRPLRLVRWGNYRQHQVPRLHPVHLFLPHEIASRKAVSGKERPAILPPPAGTDTQRAQGSGMHPGEFTHAERVQGVCLGQTKPIPVPARPPPTPSAYRQAERLERQHQGVARRIDRGSILERDFRLCTHLRVAEFRRRLMAFGRVAVVTREHQIARSIGPSSAARDLVIDLEGDLAPVTVDAAMLEFL